MRNDLQRVIPKRPFACYDAGQLEGIRSRISMQTELGEEYKRQLTLSDAFAEVETTVPIQRSSAFRTNPFVFRTPANAAYMKITFYIRGKGEVWIRQVQLTHSEKGLPIPIENGSFDQGLIGWKITSSSASSSVTILEPVEDPWLGPCLHVKNWSEDDMTLLAMVTTIPVCAEEHYSIQTTLRLDELFTDEGIYLEVSFLNAVGQPMDVVYTSPTFNRKTPTTWATLLEIAGADANAYMVTGNAVYAERAKRKILYMLADMCQGMDIFRATGWHVDDTYGAVHIGRGMAVTSVIYDQIADSDVISPDEDAAIQTHFRYIAGMMMDTNYYQFDLEQFPDEKGGKRSNWNADRATGLGIYALIFPEEELAEHYLEHACAVVDWQLEHVVDQDGAWPENIRYHGAVLHRYFLFFTLLQRLRGIDYLSRDKVKKMYRYLIGTVTPKDCVQGGPDSQPKLLSPAVGDSTVDDHWFRLFAYAAPFYAKTDPQLSREMMWAWKHGGGVVRDTGASPCTLLALLYPQLDLPQEAPELTSVHYAGIGYVIFRQHFGQWGQENYAIFESSPLTYHAHHDEGHFSIWANATPLTLDPGTGGYYNGDRHWYVNGHAHNVVQFMDEAGIVQNGPLKSICEEVYFSDQLDYVRSCIPDVHAEAYHRHFAYVKACADVYVVWDHIRSQRNSIWNLHTMSTSSDIEENRLTAHCLNEMKLEVTFLEPSRISTSTANGAVSGAYPLAVQEHFQITGDYGSDYLTLLFPNNGELSGLTVRTLSVDSDSPELRMYRVLQEEQTLFLLLVNGADHLQTFAFQADSSLLNLLDQTSYNPDPNGQCHMQLDAGRLAILIETE
ncbi:heparinase II/III domain-containing protein [Paenibacillus qinlingensis]|uniref:heparinase II/III domain-containing protein n=1 Tax=Paenibacillus qinlingensis TaxID=1837343 RepID=UPI0015640C30|nr:heparinase II/III family protein [Paenibacillus qinlingensis]NQX59744.1 heparinase II/III family protein [Paenibacillus qinlingensis]